MALEERGYYNVSQVAALLGVSRVSVWRWIRDGHLPAARLGHRTTRIKREDVERALVQIEATGSRSWIARTGAADSNANGSAGRAPTEGGDDSATDHIVQFYETDAFLAAAVAEFISGALRAGDAGVVVATGAHGEQVATHLGASGFDLDAARASGRYLFLDAAETLSRLMPDGELDAGCFAETIGGIIARAAAGGRQVRVFGEMVALLVADGNHDSAIFLEELWNDLQHRMAFSILCAYPLDRLAGAEHTALFHDVCTAHSHVVPAESYAALPTTDDRLQAIAMLQQKAQSLEAEIAERQRSEAQLRDALASEQVARQEAETARRLRDEFLSIAAHELRNPLAGLSLHAQLALRRLRRNDRVDPESVKQSLEGITGQAAKLTRMLDQLMDVSRLEAGKLTLERAPTDLAPLIIQVVAGARGRDGQHLITVATPASLVVNVDPMRLEQVLANLLSNAIKYSPAGGPIDVVLFQPEPHTVELSVRDRGIGIPPETRGAIFDRYYQARAADAKQGLGLGLYVCRQIVQLHGGEISAEFPPDGGTRIVVCLPTGQAAADC